MLCSTSINFKSIIANLSFDIMWSLFWRAAISTTSWRLVRLVFALALSSLERPPIYGQYFCNLVNSKHQQVVARPWWPWPYLKFFQQPSNLLAFNNKTQLYKADVKNLSGLANCWCQFPCTELLRSSIGSELLGTSEMVSTEKLPLK